MVQFSNFDRLRVMEARNHVCCAKCKHFTCASRSASKNGASLKSLTIRGYNLSVCKRRRTLKMISRIIVLIVACFCTSVSAQSQIRIAFNPEKGKTYTYRFITEQTSSQSARGQEMTTNYSMEFLIDMIIKDKNKNEISMDYVYKEIVFVFSHPTMNFNVDSKDKNNNTTDIAKFFDCLIGKSLQIIVSPEGSVKSITGFQPIRENMNSVITSADETVQRIAGMFIQMSFHEFAIKTNFEQSFKMYPDKAIEVGDSWSIDKSHTVGQITNNVQNTYMLKSVNDNIALIDLSVVSSLKNESLDRELKNEQKGEIMLNVENGMLVQFSSTENSNMSVSVQGTDIISNSKTKVTVYLQQ